MAEHYLSAARKGEENAAAPPEPFSPDEMDALRAKMDLFASERVRAPFDQFWGALGAYAFRFGQLQADEEAKEAGLPIPESEIEDVRNMVREAARQVTDSLAEVKQRMSEGLTDA